MVFVRNSVPLLWRLFTDRLPSATTNGIDAKLLSKSTKLDTLLAASLPDCMAIEQSASLSASTSFTPSPVIPTVRPAALSAFTNKSFWSGETRPNTVYFSAASGIFSSDTIDISTVREAFLTPALFAIFETVTGLSPEIIFISTPCFSKYLRVSGASFLIISPINKSAATLSRSGSFPSLKPSFEKAKVRTLSPSFWAVSHFSLTFSYSSLRTNSGAPNTRLPSLNSAALHFLAEEKGTVFISFDTTSVFSLLSEALFLFAPHLSFTALKVGLSSPITSVKLAKALSIGKFFSNSSTPSTLILPSVMVPVLSRQRVSTLANVSVQYISWARVLCAASLIVLTAITTLVRRYSPSGIIPISAAAVLTIARLVGCSEIMMEFTNSPMATGTIHTASTFIIVSSALSITLLFFLRYLAPAVIFEAKFSFPTLWTLAFTFPEITKLPDIISSPIFFRTGSLSPVIRLSFTSHSPSTRIQSEQIWRPELKIIRSSFTISAVLISFFSPFLKTTALGAETRLSLSTTFFALISWTIPITVLKKITPKKRQFL